MVFLKSDNMIHYNTVWKLVLCKRWKLFLARRIIQTGLADAAQSPLNLPPINRPGGLVDCGTALNVTKILMHVHVRS